MSRTKAKRSIAGIILGITFIIFLLFYMGVSIYFMSHFAFNVYVNDIPAYKMTAKEIETEVTDGLMKYVLTIKGRGDITETISANDINLSLRMDGQFDRALKEQNPLLWPAYLFKDTHLTTDNIVVYSKETVENKIDSLAYFSPENIKEPVDAYVSEESGEDGFYIVPEDYGQSPIRDIVVEKICSAIDVLEPEVTLDDECYKAPELFSDNPEMTALCDNLNNFCKANIVYEFGADTVVVDGTKIREWCTINGTEVSLDEEKVKDFVNSIARQYDTFGKTRTIISHSGEEVTVSGGDYGWWMDRSTETSELIAAIKNGDKGTRVPVYFGTAAAYGEQDYGTSYVEIDLTAQHLWVYQDGQVVEDSDFVSGCVNKSRVTPVGTYGITYKERDATLVGENYSSPVKYWMPFNGNVGMHDASWRSKFGGYDYILNGSHGCINLPTEKAEKIYDLVSKGEAVLVYGGLTSPVPVVEVEVTDPKTGEVKVEKRPVINGKVAGTDSEASTENNTSEENQTTEENTTSEESTTTEENTGAGEATSTEGETPSENSLDNVNGEGATGESTAPSEGGETTPQN
jgi:hypothetical protein